MLYINVTRQCESVILRIIIRIITSKTSIKCLSQMYPAMTKPDRVQMWPNKTWIKLFCRVTQKDFHQQRRLFNNQDNSSRDPSLPVICFDWEPPNEWNYRVCLQKQLQINSVLLIFDFHSLSSPDDSDEPVHANAGGSFIQSENTGGHLHLC